MDPREPTIEFRNVHFSINGRELVSNLNLEIQSGETLALLGRSGSGKTTTLKLINGLLLPTSGEVRVEGASTSDWDPIRLRRHIGYVIQEVGLFPHFTVERNVQLIPRLEGWPKERIKRRAREVLALVGLDPAQFLHRYPHELSGGQRQRVGVARALAADPPILLMDEPLGALDPITRSEIQQELVALKERVHKTIVLVTHDLREALLLATRTALMEAGRLAGVYSDFLSSPDPAARQYAGAFRIGEEAAKKEVSDESD